MVRHLHARRSESPAGREGGWQPETHRHLRLGREPQRRRLDGPDGDSLTYRWWHYPEPSTYKKPLAISNANSRDANFVALDVASTQTIHIILEVTDTGTPPLTRYQRVIVAVNPGPNPPAKNPALVICDAAWAWHWHPQPRDPRLDASVRRDRLKIIRNKRAQSLNVVAGYEDRPANEGELTYTWTLFSGRGTVVFDNTNGTSDGDICVATPPAPDADWDPSERYEFRVTVSNGTHSGTAPLTLVTFGTYPYEKRADPKVTTKVVRSSEINMSWGNVSGNNGYRLTRRVGKDGEWTLVATVDRHVTTYSDTGLSAGTTYDYRAQTLGAPISSRPTLVSASTQGTLEQ